MNTRTTSHADRRVLAGHGQAPGLAEAFRRAAAALGTDMDQVAANIGRRSHTAVAVRHALIRAVYQQGFSSTEIGAYLGQDHTTILFVINHSKTRPPAFGRAHPPLAPTPYRIRSRRVVDARAALAAALRDEGLSWPEVAACAGFTSHSSARAAVERLEAARHA